MKLVRHLYDDLEAEHYGLALGRKSGLSTAALYTSLARLERMGWVVARWEDIDPVSAGRPARKYFRLTETGITGYQTNLQALTSPALRGKLI
ncbi:PadR family transcriptional regulator [Deinococcus sp. HMF7604]|nr:MULTISPECIES: helix-turn-helix transcriptional regulator [Deinococcus]MBZ9752155.1 PadR family transcriptional regulator [Deinococcus betulae]